MVNRLRALFARQPEARPQIARTEVTPPTSAKIKTDRDALFASKDTNHDGQLSREKFLAGQSDPAAAPARFLRFDRDKDNVLTQGEFVRMGKAPER